MNAKTNNNVASQNHSDGQMAHAKKHVSVTQSAREHRNGQSEDGSQRLEKTVNPAARTRKNPSV